MEDGGYAVFYAAGCGKVGDVGERINLTDLMEERLQIGAVSCGVQFLQEERQRAVHETLASQTSRLRYQSVSHPQRSRQSRRMLVCTVRACNLTIYGHGEAARILGPCNERSAWTDDRALA